MEAIYDFIVVGAGASGSVVASRIANVSSKPSILLLEAGGPNTSTAQLSAAERFDVAFNPSSPLNWHYKTTAQDQLNGQEIDYSRGKGLGGSTAINFCGWVVGARDDYDEWAALVGNESFNWHNAKRQLDKIGNLHPEIPDSQMKKYVNAKAEDHSKAGPIHLTYGDSWVSGIDDIFVAAEQSGLKTNPDVNSGDPIGMGMGSVCIYKNQRLTAASAYLARPPPNLSILPNSGVASIVFDGKRAVGVRTIDGRSFFAKKEVIISGGALNTPQILMLSGVGPQEELTKHGIPIVQHLPMVGKNLQDHCFSSVGVVLKRDEKSDPNEPRQSPSPMGWFKLPSVLSSQEYESLSQRLKEFLQKPTVPSFEIATHTPPSFIGYDPSPDVYYFGAIALIMNPQSRGTVTLRSADPKAAPLIDPKFMTHPFDRRIIIESTREIMRMLSAPVFAAKTIEMLGPKGDSDEAIWDYVRQHLFSSWHMSCTVRMGTDSSSACVNSNFCVFGLEALRVVDLSVCPFVTNNHTQSTAYVLGEMAAEKIIEQYHLENPYKL